MATLTERELDVMAVLWERGSATAGEVQGVLADDLAYTSVLSVLQTLELKGAVAHEKEGRAYRYRAVLDAKQAAHGPTARLVARLFQGSPVRLLSNLLETHDVTNEDIARMREMLREAEEKKQ